MLNAKVRVVGAFLCHLPRELVLPSFNLIRKQLGEVSLLPSHSKQLLSHTQANVRKSLVFMYVDLSFLIDKEPFEDIMTGLNPNQ